MLVSEFTRTHIYIFLCLSVGMHGCTNLDNLGPPDCQKLTIGPGPEDFAVQQLEGNKVRLLVSMAKRGWWGPDTDGKIAWVNINPDGHFGNWGEMDISIPDDFSKDWDLSTFHPVGVSLVQAERPATSYLYVINIGGGRSSIDKFRLESDRPHTLLLEDSLRHPLLPHTGMAVPNDLLALPNGQIYVSVPFSGENSLVHFDPKNDGVWSAWDGLKMCFANGIAMNESGKTLFVADFWGKEIYAIQRDPLSGVLADNFCSIPLDAHPDNMMWSQGNLITDTLLVANHQSWVRSFFHLFFWGNSPSVVYEISMKTYKLPLSSEMSSEPYTEVCETRGAPCPDGSCAIYANDGSQVNAVSTATLLPVAHQSPGHGSRFSHRLIMGQLKDSEILSCGVE